MSEILVMDVFWGFLDASTRDQTRWGSHLDISDATRDATHRHVAPASTGKEDGICPARPRKVNAKLLAS